MSWCVMKCHGATELFLPPPHLPYNEQADLGGFRRLGDDGEERGSHGEQGEGGWEGGDMVTW